jgi:beta-carotene hydroxylase
MKLRHAADSRTMLWAFLFFPGAALAQYLWPALAGWMLPVSIYFGYCAAIFSHNHNHCPTFHSRKWNAFFSAWISVFYGYPTFAWIPTHNLNHHKFVDRAGDATITWRLTKKNHFGMAFIYFFISSYFQSGPTNEYIRKARTGNRAIFRQIVLQYITVFGSHLGFLALAIALYGGSLGALVYFSAFGIPSAFALWSIMYTNYIQHVHCDPWSKHNHSRNFVSPLNNFFVFNGGYHTVHHEHPGVHWSKYPALHAQIAAEIDPALNESTIVGYTVRAYLLGLFLPRFRTRQIGRAAYDVPGGQPQDLTTASIGTAAEVGVTAQSI